MSLRSLLGSYFTTYFRSANLELCGAPLYISPLANTDVSALSSGFGYNGFGSGSICAFYEGPSTRRLDVYPLKINLNGLAPQKSTGEAVVHVRKLRTADVGVQTEVLKNEMKKPLADELSDMIDKFRFVFARLFCVCNWKQAAVGT